MLTEKRDIDQLFREKLGEFSQDPPMYVWTNIRTKLNSRKRERRFAYLKIAGIAAAIFLAFLAGWLSTDPAQKGASPQNEVAISREKVKSDNQSKFPSLKPEIKGNKEIGNKVEMLEPTTTIPAPASLAPSIPSKLSSLATFAPDASVIANDKLLLQKKGDLVLFETEKDFLDHFNQDFKIVKQLTNWFKSVGKDSLKEKHSFANKAPIEPSKKLLAEGQVVPNIQKPSKSSGRWSIKAEFSPVFNNQAQNSGQAGVQNDFYLGLTGNVPPQETKTENTVSGGMMAGYKVNKRLVIKSGIAYNNLKQTTSNISIMSANQGLNFSGSSALATTPTGQVSLNKVSGNQMESVLNSSAQLDNKAVYTVGSQLKQELRFLEIPVQATYKLVDRKVSMGLTGGLSTNILIGNKAILSENGNQVGDGETSGMRNVVYSGTVGLEMGYELTNRITLTVEPRLKHFLNSLSGNKSIHYKPSQMEIVTGLAYSFN
ncbi:MAG: outer membrane beta-barrel protein [Mariniphaga sp.]